MRRGRIFIGVLAAVAATLLVAPGAFGATNREIAADLADGRLDGTYTQAELHAFLNSATTQGYGHPTQTPPPVTQVCVEVAPGTPGAVQGRDGKWYTGPNAHLCGVAPVQVPAPVTTPVGESAGQQVVTLAPVAAVAGQQRTRVAPKTKAAPAKQVAGVRTTRRTGSLPFTGVDVALLVAGGLLLLGVGAGMRTVARQRM